MRRALIALASLAVVAAVVIGLTQTNSSNSAPKPASLTPTQAAARLKGAPPALAALHAQANDLLGGGKSALTARLRELRGHPVVLNKWASWCGPCRFEFPFFQRAGVAYGKRVAFLGLDSGDNDDDARKFLRRFPVTYPSYRDPSARTSVAFGISFAFPTTVFYDARGRRQYIHQGAYLKEQRFREDIERYALGS